MDIRSFINEKPVYEDGKELEFLYQLQTGLLDKYLDIEKLPKYPININSREGQSVIKDMTARVIEEIGEGYESTTYALQMLDEKGPNFNGWSQEDYQLLLNHLQNSNEEQADALAFYLNLLLYSNIQPEDIYSYCQENLFKNVQNKSKPIINSLNFLMDIGLGILDHRFVDFSSMWDKEEGYPFNWEVLSESVMSEYFDRDDYNKVNVYTPAFHNISWLMHDNEAKFAWEMTYHLSVARNYLKNKPWKQTMELTDEIRYQGEVVYGFLLLLGYFKFIGFTPESLVRLRYCKHLTNLFRIKSKY